MFWELDLCHLKLLVTPSLNHSPLATSSVPEPCCFYSSVMWKSLSRVRLFANPWAVACQAPLSIEISRQEYWSRLPVPSPGDLRDPGIESRSPALQADSLPSEPPGKPSGAPDNAMWLQVHYPWSLSIFDPLSLPVSLIGTCPQEPCFKAPDAPQSHMSQQCTVADGLVYGHLGWQPWPRTSGPREATNQL